MDTHFITTGDVGLHNFSALELFTSQGFLAEHPAVVDTVTRLIGQGARLVSPVRRDAARWHGMWAQFDRLGLSQVDEAGYAALYS